MRPIVGDAFKLTKHRRYSGTIQCEHGHAIARGQNASHVFENGRFTRTYMCIVKDRVTEKDNVSCHSILLRIAIKYWLFILR